MSITLDPWDLMGCSLPGSSVHGIFLGKNTRVSCHFLLKGIFQTQGSNRVSCTADRIFTILVTRVAQTAFNHSGIKGFYFSSSNIYTSKSRKVLGPELSCVPPWMPDFGQFPIPGCTLGCSKVPAPKVGREETGTFHGLQQVAQLI